MNRPRPVLTAAGISGLITSLAGVLSWLGYVAPAADLSDRAGAIGAVAVGAVTLGAHLLAGLHGQARVTPLADPQTATGVALVPADQSPAVLLASATAVEPMDDTDTIAITGGGGGTSAAT